MQGTAQGDKVRRNAPCICGSQRKYKHCCGATSTSAQQGPRPYPKPIPPELLASLLEQERQQRERKTAYGLGRDIVTFEANGHRLVAVGNEIHWAPIERRGFFSDFLDDYARHALGYEWGETELRKPEAERHPIIQWFLDTAEFKRKQHPRSDGTFIAEPSGAMRCWLQLAYDLYLIQHNHKLQEAVLKRLRLPGNFQGARFELEVAATLVISGFDIAYEDETDKTSRHPELIATLSCTGLRLAIEAKSKHRHGVLGLPVREGRGTPKALGLRRMLKDAFEKHPPLPYIVFVDLNMPPTELTGVEHPWVQEIRRTIDSLARSTRGGELSANAVIFANDPAHYTPHDPVRPNHEPWLAVITPRPAHMLADIGHLVNIILNAREHRRNIPIEFPPQRASVTSTTFSNAG